jgi:caffeoyl-CoA O-methyltransferase
VSRRSTPLDEALYDYLLEASLREPEVLRALREETAGLENANMQISPEQGQLMALLVELIGARTTLEVGTFTGYSALAVALALPEGGRVVTCDISEDWTRTARRYWVEAGVSDKIDLRLGPAVDTLDGLLGDPGEGAFDFAFIDADKEGLAGYYERALRLVRTGGVIAVDNTLWHGKVADPSVDDADTEAIRRFNEKVRDDERVTLSLVPIGDGLTLTRKR